MKLENATYQLDAAWYPVLSIFVDGQPARIGWEQKFLHLDIVFLGPEWQGRVPGIEIPADKKARAPALTVRGFVKDARLAGLVRAMLERDSAGTFAPGPVDIPREGA